MLERLYPDKHVKRVEDISYEELKNKNIKAILLDIDNTIINYEREIKEPVVNWINKSKEFGIEICLLSNNTQKKVEAIANKLNVKCVHNSGKPAKKGYIRAIKLLNVKNTEIAAVGDQIFTDVYGGNRLNMHTILVEPIEIKDIWITKIKRPLENLVLTKYKDYDYQNDSKRLNWKKKSAKNKKIA